MSIKEQIKAIENKLTLLNEDEIPFEEKIEIYKNALKSITHLKKTIEDNNQTFATLQKDEL